MHPNWLIHYPYFTDSQWANVITYMHKFTRTHTQKQTPIHTVARLDLAWHPALLITDHYINQGLLHIINFYHDINDPSSLRALISLDLDEVPTILIGDLNMHSPYWSPEGWICSPCSGPFETWAANQTLKLQKGKLTSHDEAGKMNIQACWTSCGTISLPLCPSTSPSPTSAHSAHTSSTSTRRSSTIGQTQFHWPYPAMG